MLIELTINEFEAMLDEWNLSGLEYKIDYEEDLN